MRILNRILLGAALAVGVVACGDDGNTGAPDFAMVKHDMAVAMEPDMTMQNTTPDMGCYANPMTHIEIINACTDSVAQDKATNPNLPFTDAGTLPPLP